MLGLSALYIKLILSALVLSAVGGFCWYVLDLQSDKQKLLEQRTVLLDDNKELEQAIKDSNRQTIIVERVSEIGNAEREANRNIRDKQLNQIDNGVKQGKDRPVGPLLKDFFNGH